MSPQLEHLPLREVVAGEIRAMIIDGQLAQGERLIEGKLAADLGVSRNPVREAIRLLESTGLVEVLPRKGAYVCMVDVEQARQIQELRMVVEGYAAELAATRRSDADLDALLACIERGREAAGADDRVTAAACHREFHIVLERAAGNPFLERVTGPLRQQTELMFSILLEKRGVITWSEHEDIWAAIRSGDADLARESMRGHIARAIDAFVSSAEAKPREQADRASAASP
jgi:DNA-binding GntR family transcriptional regulator